VHFLTEGVTHFRGQTTETQSVAEMASDAYRKTSVSPSATMLKALPVRFLASPEPGGWSRRLPRRSLRLISAALMTNPAYFEVGRFLGGYGFMNITRSSFPENCLNPFPFWFHQRNSCGRCGYILILFWRWSRLWSRLVCRIGSNICSFLVAYAESLRHEQRGGEEGILELVSPILRNVWDMIKEN